MKTVFFKKLLVLAYIIFTITTLSANNETINTQANNPDNLSIDMYLVEKGSFIMGCTRNDKYTLEWEKPLHKVTLDYDFLISKYELTASSFLIFLNNSNANSEGYLNEHLIINMESDYCQFVFKAGQFKLKNSERSKFPVMEVTWWGATEYCNWLSEQNNLALAYDKKGNLLDKDGNQTCDITKVEGFRLPTEAEWEYAARGGENDYNTARDYKYAGSNTLDEVGWYSDNSVKDLLNVNRDLGIHEIGLLKPNEIGLYDMSGNVWEWCQDCWSENYYERSPEINPLNLEKTNPYRVFRGGSWGNVSVYCRTVARGYGKPIGRHVILGFRLAKTK